jgi:hypothetical protein
LITYEVRFPVAASVTLAHHHHTVSELGKKKLILTDNAFIGQPHSRTACILCSSRAKRSCCGNVVMAPPFFR